MRLRIVAAMVLGVTLGASAYAADATMGLDLVSAYVFRGVTYNDGPCLQPYVETSTGAFTFNVWANFDLNDYEPIQSGDFSEVDFTLSHGFALGEAELSVGVMEFLFPEGGTDTNTGELFVAADAPLTGGLSASGYFGYDFVVVDDMYASLGVSYELPIELPMLAVSFTAGYAGEDASAGGKAGLHEYAARLDATYPISDMVELAGFAVYTAGLDDEVLPEQDVEAFGGVSLSYSF